MEKVMQNAYLAKSGIEYDALSLTLFCWQVFDSLFNSDIASISRFLYLSPKHFNKTFINKSISCNISLRSLSRYRKKFVNSFKFILNYLENNLLLEPILASNIDAVGAEMNNRFPIKFKNRTR